MSDLWRGATSAALGLASFAVCSHLGFGIFTPRAWATTFPRGRFVLRGDGVTSAYQWVWIANPAAAPSGALGPAAPQPAR